MAHNIYEPGKPHKGVYHAYVRVSTDKQDIERQNTLSRPSSMAVSMKSNGI